MTIIGKNNAMDARTCEGEVTLMPVTCTVRVRVTLQERHIPFVNVKCVGVIFDKLTWRIHIEIIAAKALRIFISI